MTTQHAIQQCQQLIDEIEQLTIRRKAVQAEANREVERLTGEIHTLYVSLVKWNQTAAKLTKVEEGSVPIQHKSDAFRTVLENQRLFESPSFPSHTIPKQARACGLCMFSAQRQTGEIVCELFGKVEPIEAQTCFKFRLSTIGTPPP